MGLSLQDSKDPSICSRCGGDLEFKYADLGYGRSEIELIYCPTCKVDDEEYDEEWEREQQLINDNMEIKI